jgi:hypothetical protein
MKDEKAFSIKEYSIGGRKWVRRTNLKYVQLWDSGWFCNDGDSALLYICKDIPGFELRCFSGIPASSYINVELVDFAALWDKVVNINSDIGAIGNYTVAQQSIIIADWLCSLFCEYKELTNKT